MRNKFISFGLALVALVSVAATVYVKISQFPNTATLADSDLFLVASGSTNKNVSWDQLKDLNFANLGTNTPTIGDILTATGVDSARWGSGGVYGLANLKLSRSKFAKLSARYTNTLMILRVAIIGDSYSQAPFRWSGDFRSLLKSACGDAGAGWVSWSAYDSALTNQTANKSAELNDVVDYARSGKWYDNNHAASTNLIANSPDLLSIYCTNYTDNISCRVLKNYDIVTIFGRQHPNGAPFQVKFENPGVTTNATSLSLDGTEGLFAAQLYNIQSNSTLRISHNSGTDKRLEIYGVTLMQTNSGAAVHKLASSGTRVSHWLSMPNVATFTNAIGTLAPDLCVLMFGANDQQQYGSSIFKTNLTALIATLRAASPAAEFLLVAPPENGYGTHIEPMENYASAALDIAKTERCAFVDLQYGFGSGGFNTYSNVFDADLLHPTVNLGSGIILDQIWKNAFH